MDLRQLRYFVALAAERNFTKAADRLHIAQPPLSRQIQQLEAEFGVDLIDRTARPLALTEAGRLLNEEAAQILERVEAMRKVMDATRTARVRRFVIGFVASTIYARLPTLIRQFRAAAPAVELVLTEHSSIDQIAALKEGRIDVGFGRIRLEDEAVRRIVLREETLMVALPATHPLAQGTGKLSLRVLAGERLIIYPRHPRPSYADQVLSVFHDHGLDPVVAHQAGELQIAVGLVAAEEGICLVPESVRNLRSNDVCYRELLEAPTSPIIMSYRLGDHSPDIALMARVIIQTYRHWNYEIPEGLRRFIDA